MRPYVTIAVACLAMAGGMCVNAYSQRRVDLRDFMLAKLTLSQKALEGLVTDDLAAVESSAEKMKALTLEESWKVLQTADYVEQSRKFREATDALAAAAKKNNLEKSTAAFSQVTARCVECHKYLRDVRMAKAGQ
jgi:cytochrome c556